MSPARTVLVGLVVVAGASALAAPPASALDPTNPLCGSAGVMNSPIAKGCAGDVGGAAQVVVGGAVRTVGGAAGSLASSATETIAP